MFADLLEQLRRHEDLTSTQAAAAMGEMMDGRVEPAVIAGLLMALALKGERPPEMAGFATAMRARMVRLPVAVGEVFDTCGTGGDHAGTFNVSTAAAFVLAGAGVKVAKHGNRGASSQCGSADVLQVLGIDLEAAPDRIVTALDQAGLAFFFAPAWHPSMRHVGPTRRALGVRTAFNLVGPLTNPAGALRQLVGVSRPEQTELLARTLGTLGSERAWVVHGAGGLDEVSTLGYTKVSEFHRGVVNTFYLHPSDVRLPTVSLADLAGGTAAENAAVIDRMLAGERGPRREIVCLNAGAALLVAGRAESLEEGVARAEASLDEGRAHGVLTALRRVCGT